MRGTRIAAVGPEKSRRHREAPVTALQGVSDGDAEKLAAAFDIETVGDLGTNKFVLWAQAFTKLAE